jgi:hypothetical protein
MREVQSKALTNVAKDIFIEIPPHICMSVPDQKKLESRPCGRMFAFPACPKGAKKRHMHRNKSRPH